MADAERFVAGENPSPIGNDGSSPPPKFYAVKSGRVPGIYQDWPSAQKQITGWQKPRHRCFTTRVEAQRFLDEDETRELDNENTWTGESYPSMLNFVPDTSFDLEVQPPVPKKAKRTAKSTKAVNLVYNEADFEPGFGPLPPDAEDGFDPNIMLDPISGKLVYKTQEQRQATKLRPSAAAQTEPIRIHTDGSSLGNGRAGAFAGVGVYFGPGDKRYGLIETFHIPVFFELIDQWQERFRKFARIAPNESTG